MICLELQRMQFDKLWRVIEKVLQRNLGRILLPRTSLGRGWLRRGRAVFSEARVIVTCVVLLCLDLVYGVVERAFVLGCWYCRWIPLTEN
ncbi:hypothetical protein Micbo1qcDRAFT_23562 [Microdochium bolleyi]|uniref:Transmembrane protein n=1 Tax=Microdochium bolleyi TaxID=196109 RepID=A0A136JCW0_9PEZI|nr:hypothetical protein Micbo1qcDRAFT_23562 [Microdochium bolleyi]